MKMNQKYYRNKQKGTNTSPGHKTQITKNFKWAPSSTGLITIGRWSISIRKNTNFVGRERVVNVRYEKKQKKIHIPKIFKA